MQKGRLLESLNGAVDVKPSHQASREPPHLPAIHPQGGWNLASPG